jgi:hypothetical protein
MKTRPQPLTISPYAKVVIMASFRPHKNHIFQQVTLSFYAGIPALNYANKEDKGFVCVCVRASERARARAWVRTRCFVFNL